MRRQLPVLLLVWILSSSTSIAAQDTAFGEQGQNPQVGEQVTPPSEAAPEPHGEQEPAEKAENPPEPESHGTRLRWQDIPKNVVHDQIAIFTSPFRINRNNARPWIVFGGGTLALIAVDQKFSNSMAQENRLTSPSKWASRLGSDYFLFPAWATFYLVGKVGDKPRARDTARLGIEALIDADITAGVLKLATQRPRPEIKGESVRFFRGGDAFPSGHSIKAWALARVVSREYSDNRIVPIVAYGLAASVAISRVGGRRHSPSDALAGSAMGFFIGDFVYRHHHAPSAKPTALNWLANHVDFTIGP
jgi:membrane-associated phospholipid phosphatase